MRLTTVLCAVLSLSLAGCGVSAPSSVAIGLPSGGAASDLPSDPNASDDGSSPTVPFEHAAQGEIVFPPDPQALENRTSLTAPLPAPLPGFVDPYGTANELARIIIEEPQRRLAAIVTALGVSGFRIIGHGEPDIEPIGVPNGLAFDAVEVKLMAQPLASRTFVRLDEIAAGLAASDQQLSWITEADLLDSVGVAGNGGGVWMDPGKDSSTSLLSWRLILEGLASQSAGILGKAIGPQPGIAYKTDFEPVSGGEPAPTYVNLVTLAMLMRGVAGQLVAAVASGGDQRCLDDHARCPHRYDATSSTIGLIGLAAPDGGTSGQLLSSGFTCDKTGIAAYVSDASEAVLGWGFGEMVTKALTSFAGKAGAGAITGQIGILSLVADISIWLMVAFNVPVEIKLQMIGGPLLRTEDTHPGEQRNLVGNVTLLEDPLGSNAGATGQFWGCLKTMLSIVGLGGIDPPSKGGFKGGRLVMSLLSDTPPVQLKETDFGNAITTTDDNGNGTVVVEGSPFAVACEDGGRPTGRLFKVQMNATYEGIDPWKDGLSVVDILMSGPLVGEAKLIVKVLKRVTVLWSMYANFRVIDREAWAPVNLYTLDPNHPPIAGDGRPGGCY